MARFSAEQVADMLMGSDNDLENVGNDSSEMDSDDSEFQMSSSDKEDPTVSSESDSSDDSYGIPAVQRGRQRTRGCMMRTRDGVRTRGGGRGVNSVQRSRSVSPVIRRNIRHNAATLHDWTDIAAEPPNFQFVATPGLKNAMPNSSPADFLELFLTPELVDLMVTETNRYAEAEINKQRPLRRNSRLKDWKDTNATEMEQYLGLLLHMGPVTLPTLERYWHTGELYKTTLFSGVMSLNRFQLLLRFWHFADNNSADITDRLYKLRPVLKHFNNTMDQIYYPRRNLSIDESMVLWRGRLVFRQYIKNKRHKYGIKLFELCESRGLVLRLRVYTGTAVDDDAGLGQSGAMVLRLLDGYLDKGHAVYTDNYYNSVGLVKRLTNRSTYLCGTLQFDRKENPREVVSKKLKKGEHIWRRSESVVVCKWKDKRDVLTISNMHQIEMINVTSRRENVSQKPNVVSDYNEGMSGIDRSDQMLSYYTALRKTLRWYKKMGLHILEIFVINAHILYHDNNPGNEMRLLKFREAVTVYLLGDAMSGFRSPPMRVPEDTFHYLESLPPTEKKMKPTKPCRICTKAGRRRETRYACAVCADKPALCVDQCFKNYHIN